MNIDLLLTVTSIADDVLKNNSIDDFNRRWN